MNLYKISADQIFLDKIADFIISNFASYEQLKIILPNGFACLNLQRILVQKKGVMILPTIIPFSEIRAESEEIFKVPSENIASISYLEEKLILAEIINNYPKLGFNISQSLKFSSQLANLFEELIYNNISIVSIKDLPTVNQAEHWQFIYEFLIYAYDNWQRKIAAQHKLNRADYWINMLASEINRLKQDSSSSLIVAGIFGDNKVSWSFLENIAKLPNGFLILPPISDFLGQSMESEQLAAEDPLYCLKKLLKIINNNLADFQSLTSQPDKGGWLDSLITEKPLKEIDISWQQSNEIEYLEFDDIFQEAEAIALTCQKFAHKKIALVINNEQSKEIYANFLAKYCLEFYDLFGSDLAKINASHLIIAVSDILCSQFDIKKIAILLKNPLINSPVIMRLEKLLIKGANRFIANWDQLLGMVEADNDSELFEWCWHLAQLFDNRLIAKPPYPIEHRENAEGGTKAPLNGSEHSSLAPSYRPLAAARSEIRSTLKLTNNFNNILRAVIDIAEQLCINLWSNSKAATLADFFAELIKVDWHYRLDNITTFPAILSSLITGARFFDNDLNCANIIICRAENAALVKFDLVILADFSEGNWPPAQLISPWLNKQMRQELELYSNIIRGSLSLYNFYLLLHNEQVIITRSEKQGDGSRLLPSSYMLKLQFMLKSIFGARQTATND